MARVHKWYFLVNEVGEPIPQANVYITIAGEGGIETGTPVWIYYDEFGSGGTRNMPQGTTLDNGYFEFWLDEDENFEVCTGTEVDNSAANSYGFNTKFRIDWRKTGVYSGHVDFVDVFPANRYYEQIDVSQTDTFKNKVISNFYGNKWDTHADSTAIGANELELSEIHGLSFVNVEEKDTYPTNKLINNYLGWLWSQHEASTINNWELSGYGYPPHDLWPGDPDADPGESDYSTYNKVVSNELLQYIYNTLAETKSEVFTIGTGDWSTVVGGDDLSFALEHNLGELFPDVTCWGYYNNEWLLLKTAEITMINSNWITIRIATDRVEMRVRVSV